jgi:hypothetical protein
MFASVQASPSLISVQSSMPSSSVSTPAVQQRFGHELDPLHVVSGSHCGPQTNPAGRTESAGQLLEEPLHVSAMSQPPGMAGRQTWPAGMVAQVPFVGAPATTLHAMQSVLSEPPQAELQQTPSAQKPDAQSESTVHDETLTL